MNKILAVTLPLFYFIFVCFPEWEYCWVFRSLTSCSMGYAIIYLWKYQDLKNELLNHLKINEIHNLPKS